MDNLLVIKVKYNGSMCRISAANSPNSDVISFAGLEERLRSSFKLAPSSALLLTYTDADGDVINLSSDQDIVDALLYQRLNPLRLDLAVVEASVPFPKSTEASIAAPAPSPAHAAAVPAAAAAAGATPVVSAAAEAEVPTAAAAGATPAASDAAEAEAPAPTLSADAVLSHKLADLVGQQLKGVLGVSEDVGSLAKAYDPLLKATPGRISEVLDAALKSGLPVSFEPVPGPPASSAPSSSSSFSSSASSVEAPASHGTAVAVQKEKDAAEPAAPDTTGVAVAGAEAAAAAVAAPTLPSSPVPAVHSGIICDGCGMSPLVGARYKSLVKHDYDLCQACFNKASPDAADFKCLLQPVFRPRHPWLSPSQSAGRPMRCGPPGLGGRSMHHRGPAFVAPHADVKLEARFVKDVTVPDNTEVLPGARFTKTWRMRNTGTSPWPERTQIVHIGGDMLGERSAFLLQVPVGGVPPEAELDVSVDMVAPPRLGRYMSHWRLCSPHGPKFGHRIWALIQVVTASGARVAVAEEPAKALPVPVPAVSDVVAEVKVSAPGAPPAPVVVEEVVEGKVVTPVASPAPVVVDEVGEVEVFAPVVVEEGKVVAPVVVAEVEEQDPVVAAIAAAAPPAVAEVETGVAGAPVKEDVDVEVVAPAAVEVPAAAAGAAVESSSVGNFSIVDVPSAKAETEVGFVDAPAAAGAASAPNGEAMNGGGSAAAAVKAKVSSAPARERVFVEDEAEAEPLDELENMGFEDRELNKAVLAKAKGDLFAAVESLMNVAEWDPMLLELEEMGFDDKMLNKRIMFKNGGNVRSAVKELVHFYRDQ